MSKNLSDELRRIWSLSEEQLHREFIQACKKIGNFFAIIIGVAMGLYIIVGILIGIGVISKPDKGYVNNYSVEENFRKSLRSDIKDYNDFVNENLLEIVTYKRTQNKSGVIEYTLSTYADLINRCSSYKKKHTFYNSMEDDCDSAIANNLTNIEAFMFDERVAKALLNFDIEYKRIIISMYKNKDKPKRDSVIVQSGSSRSSDSGSSVLSKPLFAYHAGKVIGLW